MYRLHRGIMASGDGLYAAVRSFGPAAWYQPGVGVTTSLWPDQSGNSRDMTLYNSPTVNADGSVTFDGVNQYGRTADFTIVSPYTIYFVYKPLAWTGGRRILACHTSPTQLIQNPTSTPDQVLFNGVSTITAANGPVIGSYGVYAIVSNGASSLTVLNAGSAVTGDPGNSDLAGIAIAAQGSGANYSNIQAKELIAFPAAHTAAERSVVRNYLAVKHGIAL